MAIHFGVLVCPVLLGEFLEENIVPWTGLATGLESIQLPFPAAPTGPSPQQSKLAQADAAFAESDLVKQLKERSDQNRDKYALTLTGFVKHTLSSDSRPASWTGMIPHTLTTPK
jgi:hypothetical protein